MSALNIEQHPLGGNSVVGPALTLCGAVELDAIPGRKR